MRLKIFILNYVITIGHGEGEWIFVCQRVFQRT